MLEQTACLDKVASDAVEHAVDVTAALTGGVEFGDIHVFVDAHADGDVGEGHHLGDGNLHDDDVHIGQAGEVPVTGGLAHETLVLGIVKDGSAEQLAGVILLFVAVPLGQQLFLGTILFLEALDGLQYEGINDLLVVVPVKTLVFEDGVKLVIVHEEGLVELAPQFAVGLIVVFLTLHVLLVDVAALDGLEELADGGSCVFPGEFLGADKVGKCLVLFELKGKAVEHKFL